MAGRLSSGHVVLPTLLQMTRRAQGIAVALAVILGIALASGGVVVLAGSGSKGTTTTRATAIVGTNGPDRLVGTNRHDEIDGRGGADVILGRGGKDALRGDAGRDRVVGGKKFDRIFGGGGRDTIRARDRGPDTIECGSGRDVAVVGRVEDGVYDCQELHLPKPSQARTGR
jgi:Ca2+-binding RTX toxin-like protein